MYIIIMYTIIEQKNMIAICKKVISMIMMCEKINNICKHNVILPHISRSENNSMSFNDTNIGTITRHI